MEEENVSRSFLHDIHAQNSALIASLFRYYDFSPHFNTMRRNILRRRNRRAKTHAQTRTIALKYKGNNTSIVFCFYDKLSFLLFEPAEIGFAKNRPKFSGKA